MTISNLQNLFSLNYPTVQFHTNHKIIGPVTLPTKIGEQKTELQCYLYAGETEHYLVCLFGNINQAENVLVRVSSACVFGFILNSLLCDCKNQFEEAAERMLGANSGILIFGLDQHGKGVGIEAHFLVYAEGQRRNKGLFSEIYEDLGLAQDYRNYAEIISILQYFQQQNNFKKITMLTEAPDKRKYFSEKCQEVGIEINFDRFNTDVTPENWSELTEKVANGYEIYKYNKA